jgi:hypothetical protein
MAEKFSHRCGKGKPAVEKKMACLNPLGPGLGHHLDQDICCLAEAFPAAFRPVGAAVKILAQGNEPVLFLA